MRVIAVVFGAPTPKARNAQITKMLDYAFSHYETKPLYKKGETITMLPVSKGKKKSVAVVTSEPISVLLKKGEKSEAVKTTWKLNKKAKAPVKKGDVLGTLVVKKDGAVIVKSPLVAKEQVEEIAKILDVPHEEIVFALDAIQDPVSLFEPIYNDGGDPIYVMDQLSDEKNRGINWIEEIALKEGLRRLNEREKMIIRKRFFQGKTQMEVAEEIGISQAQVSRLEKAAIKQMNKNVQW